MPFKDLREYIVQLEKAGEVQRFEDEVDWNLVAGAISRRSAEAGLPAPFFQRIKGYPDGYRLISGTAAKFSRIAIALEMDPRTHPGELVREYLRRRQESIKPRLVKDGPCKENVHSGQEVDLLEFPVPMIHDGDGGRYIGTWHVTICKDSDSDWVNWGMYRHMLHNKNTVGILQASPGQHLGLMFAQGYVPRNRPMEVAIAIGVEPVSALCAGSPVPQGVSEVDIAGGIRGEPVELVKCETIDLAVPATAEIVIEGEMRPNDVMEEGPFGEFTGYVAGGRKPRPVIHVKAVTHRNNPILTMACPGVPVDDHCAISLTRGVELLQALRLRGLPITGVGVFPETVGLLIVVAVKNAYAGVADDVAHVVWASRIGNSIPYVIIVEDDVDPFNMGQVLHALVTKCHPRDGVIKLERSPATPLLPFLNKHERDFGLGAKVYFDCTWPKDWNPTDVPLKSSFATVYPPEVQKEALAEWHKYGY